jgi:hypothetical protein
LFKPGEVDFAGDDDLDGVHVHAGGSGRLAGVVTGAQVLDDTQGVDSGGHSADHDQDGDR